MLYELVASITRAPRKQPQINPSPGDMEPEIGGLLKSQPNRHRIAVQSQSEATLSPKAQKELIKKANPDHPDPLDGTKASITIHHRLRRLPTTLQGRAASEASPAWVAITPLLLAFCEHMPQAFTKHLAVRTLDEHHMTT